MSERLSNLDLRTRFWTGMSPLGPEILGFVSIWLKPVVRTEGFCRVCDADSWKIRIGEYLVENH